MQMGTDGKPVVKNTGDGCGGCDQHRCTAAPQHQTPSLINLHVHVLVIESQF